MSNAYRNSKDIERALDMLEYERFKDFMPNKRLEEGHQTQARRARAERKLWSTQRELITRAWG